MLTTFLFLNKFTSPVLATFLFMNKFSSSFNQYSPLSFFWISSWAQYGRIGELRCRERANFSDLNANLKWYWPRRTSYTIGSTGPAKSLLVLQYFLLHNEKKHFIKLTDNIYFYLFYLHLFQKHLGRFLGGNLLTRMSPIVYWFCRTSWGLFLLARSHFWEFLLAWALGLAVHSYVEPWFYFVLN